jgi:hypothetical protein
VKLWIPSNLLPLAGFQIFKKRDSWIDYNILGLKTIRKPFTHIFFGGGGLWTGCVQIMVMWYILCGTESCRVRIIFSLCYIFYQERHYYSSVNVLLSSVEWTDRRRCHATEPTPRFYILISSQCSTNVEVVRISEVRTTLAPQNVSSWNFVHYQIFKSGCLQCRFCTVLVNDMANYVFILQFAGDNWYLIGRFSKLKNEIPSFTKSWTQTEGYTVWYKT